MKDYESFPPLRIKSAEGSHLTLEDGTTLVDAIGSWWCKPFGHQHPRLKAALLRQADRFEHVILANTSSDLLEELAAELVGLGDVYDKVFFAGDGSTAVEVALKMALQYQLQSGFPSRNKFAYLQNAYHGETIGCYAVSDLGLYKRPFEALGSGNNVRLPLPETLSGETDHGWRAPSDDAWAAIESVLEASKEQLAAVVVEPVLQGAAGMRLYSPVLLKKLRSWTSKSGVLLVADEVMTGLARTGRALASEHAGIEADLVCVMKGLSAGWAPFSAVLAPQAVFEAFYGDYHSGRAFMHSNTYSGYALGASVALEALKMYREGNWAERVRRRSPDLRNVFERVQATTNCLQNVRSLGFVAAADLVGPSGESLDPRDRTGYQVFTQALKHGALLRPLGDTIYLFPPFNIDDADLGVVEEALLKGVGAVLGA